MLSAQASEIGRRPLVFRSLDFKGKEEKTRHIQRHTVRPSAYKSIARWDAPPAALALPLPNSDERESESITLWKRERKRRLAKEQSRCLTVLKWGCDCQTVKSYGFFKEIQLFDAIFFHIQTVWK